MSIGELKPARSDREHAEICSDIERMSDGVWLPFAELRAAIARRAQRVTASQRVASQRERLLNSFDQASAVEHRLSEAERQEEALAKRLASVENEQAASPSGFSAS